MTSLLLVALEAQEFPLHPILWFVFLSRLEQENPLPDLMRVSLRAYPADASALFFDDLYRKFFLFHSAIAIIVNLQVQMNYLKHLEYHT